MTLLVVRQNAQTATEQVADQVAVEADVVIVAMDDDRRALGGALRLETLHGKLLAVVFEPLEGLPEIEIEEAPIARPETVARNE